MTFCYLYSYFLIIYDRIIKKFKLSLCPYSKTFKDILKAAAIHACNVMKDILETPLLSTGVLRNFWLTCDKATIGRTTVQCVLIVSTYGGVKSIFPVGAPSVYHHSLTIPNSEIESVDDDTGWEAVEQVHDDTLDSDVSVLGGSHEALAVSLKTQLSTRLGLSEESMKCLTGM